MTTTPRTIPALSIRPPFAQLIIADVKPPENRSWTTSYRGPLIVHASQRWEQAGLILAAAEGHRVVRAECAHGYIGVVQLIGIHHATGCGSDDPCGIWGMPDQWHWVTADPTPFAEPVPGPGRLGLYAPPTDVQDLARDLLAGAA